MNRSMSISLLGPLNCDNWIISEWNKRSKISMLPMQSDWTAWNTIALIICFPVLSSRTSSKLTISMVQCTFKRLSNLESAVFLCSGGCLNQLHSRCRFCSIHPWWYSISLPGTSLFLNVDIQARCTLTLLSNRGWQPKTSVYGMLW